MLAGNEESIIKKNGVWEQVKVNVDIDFVCNECDISYH